MDEIINLVYLLEANGWESESLYTLKYKNLSADVYDPNNIKIYVNKAWYAQNGTLLFTITNSIQLNKFLDFLKSLC